MRARCARVFRKFSLVRVLVRRTIWENTERSRDVEIFKKKYQGCNQYIYAQYIKHSTGNTRINNGFPIHHNCALR